MDPSHPLRAILDDLTRHVAQESAFTLQSVLAERGDLRQAARSLVSDINASRMAGGLDPLTVFEAGPNLPGESNDLPQPAGVMRTDEPGSESALRLLIDRITFDHCRAQMREIAAQPLGEAECRIAEGRLLRQANSYRARAGLPHLHPEDVGCLFRPQPSFMKDGPGGGMRP